MTNTEVAESICRTIPWSHTCQSADRLEECWPDQRALDDANRMVARDDEMSHRWAQETNKARRRFGLDK